MKIHALISTKLGSNDSDLSTISLMITQLKIKKEGFIKKILIDFISNDENFDFINSSLFVFGNSKNEILFDGKIYKEPIYLGDKIFRIYAQVNEEIFCNDSIYDLTNFVLQDSIVQNEKDIPENIKVCLTAEWIQKINGISNIGDIISSRFTNGMINSLNKEFKIKDTNISGSGYNIIESYFKDIPPPFTGNLDLYNPSEEKTNSINNNIEIPKKWFNFDFKIEWNYEQKRINKLYFYIPTSNNIFDKKISYDDKVDISLKISNLENYEGFDKSFATLFDKDIGKNIISESFNAIKNILKENYKTNISFNVTIEEGLKLYSGQKIKISNERYSYFGKVSEISIIADGINQYSTIKINIIPKWLENIIDEKFENWVLHEEKKVEGIEFDSIKNGDIVEDIIVENDSFEQYRKLNKENFCEENEITNFINQNPTSIVIKMKNLITKKALIHKNCLVFNNGENYVKN